ncbi:helix-turn-helix domain-containing protein [Streptomyces sp. NPDC047737]|uniref:helix-turn-helix domain-containing protein n=1 Tax=Streptomyces sp. NPDC047737 TaxID=3155740 RepID=UPI0033D212F4
MTPGAAGSSAGPAPAAPPPSAEERRRLREARALSEEQVAAAVGATPATVRAWEAGRTSPRGRRRAAYARLIGATETRPEPHPSVEATGSTTMSPTEPGTAPAPAAPSPDAPSTGAPPTIAPPQNTPPSHLAPAPAPPPDAPSSSALPSPAPSPAAPSPSAPPSPTPSPTAPPPSPASPSSAATSPDAPSSGVPRRVVAPPTAVPSSGGAPTDLPALRLPHAHAPAPAAAVQAAAPVPEAPASLTAEAAFDALYDYAAPGLTRQTYLLTGRRKLCREAVEHAFRIAWQRWPEVARDRDPAGWVRAAAYEYAMSPWHRLRRTHRRLDPLPEDPERRLLLDTLLGLPVSYRHTLLLHDGVGLGLPETAAETEASTPAAASRLLNARASVTERLPALAEPAGNVGRSEVLHERLGELALAEDVPAPPPAPAVRAAGERIARLWTRAAAGFAVLLIGTTAFTLQTAPTQYEQPLAPPERVGGVPPRGGPEKLTPQDLKLQKLLREKLAHGPERLVPKIP